MDPLSEYEPNVRKHLLVGIFEKLADPALDLETLKEIARNEAIPYVWRWQDDFEGHFIKDATDATAPLRNATANLVELLLGIVRRSGLPEVTDRAEPASSESPQSTGQTPEELETGRLEADQVTPESRPITRIVLGRQDPGSEEPGHEVVEQPHPVRQAAGEPRRIPAFLRNESGYIPNLLLRLMQEPETVTDDDDDDDPQSPPPNVSQPRSSSFTRGQDTVDDDAKTIEHRFRFLSTDDAEFCEAALSILFHIADGSGGGVYNLSDVVDFAALGRLTCSLLYAVNVNVSMNAVRVLSQVAGAARYFPPLEIPRLLLAMSLTIPSTNGSSSRWDGCSNPMEPLYRYLVGKRKFFSGVNNEEPVDEEALRKLDDPMDFAANSVGDNAPYYIGDVRLKRASTDVHQVAMLASQQMYSLCALMILLSPNGYESVVATRAPDAIHTLLDVCRTHHDDPTVNYTKSCIVEGITIILSFWTKANDEKVFKRWQLTPILHDLLIPGLDEKYIYQLCDLASFASMRTLLPLMPRFVEMSVDPLLPPEGRLRSLDVLARILMTPEFSEENIVPDRMLESLFAGLQSDVEDLVRYQAEWKEKAKLSAKAKAKAKARGKHYVELGSPFDPKRLYQLVTERTEVFSLWVNHLTWSDLDRTLLATPFVDLLVQLLTEPKFLETLPTRALMSMSFTLSKICESEQGRILLLSEQGLSEKLYESMIALSQARNRPLDLVNVIATIYKCLWGDPQSLEEEASTDGNDRSVSSSFLKANRDHMRNVTVAVLQIFIVNMKKLLEDYTHRAATDRVSGLVTILVIARAQKVDCQSLFSKFLSKYFELSSGMDLSRLSLRPSSIVGPLNGTYEDAVSLNELSDGLLVKYAITTPSLGTADLVPNFKLEPHILDDLLRSSAELAAAGLPLQLVRLLRLSEIKNDEHVEPLWFKTVIPTPLVFKFLVDAVVYAVDHLEYPEFQEFIDFGFLESALGSDMMTSFTFYLLKLLKEICSNPNVRDNYFFPAWNSDKKRKLLELFSELVTATPADDNFDQVLEKTAFALMRDALDRGEHENLKLARTFYKSQPTQDLTENELNFLRGRYMAKYGLDGFLIPELRLLTPAVESFHFLLSEIKRDNLRHSMRRHSDGVRAAFGKLPLDCYVRYRSLFFDLLDLTYHWDKAYLGSEERTDDSIVPRHLVEWSTYDLPGRWLSLTGVLVMRMTSVPEIVESQDYRKLLFRLEQNLVQKIADNKTQNPLAFKTLHLIYLNGLRCRHAARQDVSHDAEHVDKPIHNLIPFETQAKFISACKTALHHFVKDSAESTPTTQTPVLEAAVTGLTSFTMMLVQTDTRLASVAVKSGLVQELIDAIAIVPKDQVRCLGENLMGLCHVIMTSPSVMAGILIEMLNGRDQYHRCDLLGRRGKDISPAEAIVRRQPQLSRIVEANFVKSDNGHLIQWHIVEKAAKQAGMKVQTPKYLKTSRYASLNKSAMRTLITQLCSAFLSPSAPVQAEVLRDVLRDLIITSGKTRETIFTQFPRFAEDAIVQHSIQQTHQNASALSDADSSRGAALVSQIVGYLTRKSRDEPHSAATLKSLERSTRHVLHSVVKILDVEVPRRKQRFPNQALALLHTCCDIIRHVWGEEELAWHNLAFIAETADDDESRPRVFNQSIVQEVGAMEALMRAVALFDFSTQALDGLRSKILNLMVHVVKQDAFKVVRGSRYAKLANDSDGADTNLGEGNARNVAALHGSDEEDVEVLEADLAAERRREHQQRIEGIHGNVFRNSSLGDYESSSESEDDSMDEGDEDSDMMEDEAMDFSEYEEDFSQDGDDVEMMSELSGSEDEGSEFPQLEITLVLSADEDDNSSADTNDSSDDEAESVLEQNALDQYLDQIDMRQYESSSDNDEAASDEAGGEFEREIILDGENPGTELPEGLQVGAEVLLLYDGPHSEDMEEIDEDASSVFLASQSYRQLGYFESAFRGDGAKLPGNSAHSGMLPIEENSGMVCDSLQLFQPDKHTLLAALAEKIDAAAETRLHGRIQTINEVRHLLNDPLSFAQFRFALKDNEDPRLPLLPQLMAMLSRIMFTDIFDHDRFVLHEILSWVSFNPLGSHMIMTLLNVLLNASRGYIDTSYAALSRSATPKASHPATSPSKSTALTHTALPSATTPALVCSNLLLILSDFFSVSKTSELSFESEFRAGILAMSFGTSLSRAKRLSGEEDVLLHNVEGIARHVVASSGAHLIGLFTVALIGGFREQQIAASELISQVFQRAKDHCDSGSTSQASQGELSSNTRDSLHVKLDGTLSQQLVEALGSRQCNSRVFYNITKVVKEFMSPDALILPIVEAIRGTKSDLISQMSSVSREQQRPSDPYNTARCFDNISKDQLRVLRLFTLIGELFSQYKCLVILQRLGLIGLWSKVLEFVEVFRQKQTLGHAPLMALLDTVTLPGDIILREYESASKNEIDENDYADEGGAISEFAKEVEKFLRDELPHCQSLVNEQLRQKPRLMHGPLGRIALSYNLLDFENKQRWLEKQIDESKEKFRHHNLLFTLTRDQVLERTIKDFADLTVEELRHPMMVQFEGELGIDEGGVSREWFEILSREIASPEYGLFIPTVVGSSVYQVNPSLEVTDEVIGRFRFVGRIIARSVFDRRAFGLHFSRVIYKHILHQEISLSDMEAVDQDYYRSLKWMLENDITDVFFETFSYELDRPGVTQTVDLIPNGRHVTVNESNKHEYVRLIVHYRLVGAVKSALDALEEGFYDVLDRSWVSIFNEQELELLISGLPTIDIEDWRRNTKLEGYTSRSPQVVWFWLAVKSFSAEQKARLLQFSTGTSRVPARGFGMLASNTGVGKFTIQKERGSTDRLPTSHTCMNQISLPEYESYKKLRTLLLKAITEGNEGFGFA